jgi:arsenical pump membrane protein
MEITPAHTILVWVVSAGTVAAILFRPHDWPEAIWACLGGVLLILFGVLSFLQACSAIAKGTDVYLFLTGMMLLAELARREGVFDWLATKAVRLSGNSRSRLFGIVYLVGTMVTIFLSNDATAVVLTPAVYAAVKKARSEPLPYLLICAFIANAASFVLPISNPANLVVYGKAMPPLLTWLRTFALASGCSILVTYFTLRWIFRKEVAGDFADDSEPALLTSEGRRAAWGIAATGAILMGASAAGLDLGLPTFVVALSVALVTTRARVGALGDLFKAISWSVLPLVAGLFAIVEGIDQTSARRHVEHLLGILAAMPRVPGDLLAAFGLAALSNLVNNLPAGLLISGALHSTSAAHIRDAILIGVDLGPNLSVTGSLATILWLLALRREGERIDGWQFLRIGAFVVAPALFLTTLCLSLTAN